MTTTREQDRRARMTPVEAVEPQHMRALAGATETRLALAQVKRDLASGRLTLEAAMSDPPPELSKALLIDVIRWTRGRNRSGKSLAIIGREALDDGVNLMLSIASASPQTRAWVAERGYRSWRPS